MALRGTADNGVNRGGRPSKGRRYQTTLRVSEETGMKLVEAADQAGYAVNELVSYLLEAALANGLAPPPAAQQSLLTA
jgi:predicted HicB family RNase H-like nuclease